MRLRDSGELKYNYVEHGIANRERQFDFGSWDRFFIANITFRQKL